MKKYAFIAIVSLAAISAFASRNDDLARMSHQVDMLISQNADQLSLQQTAQIYELLSRIQQTVGKPLPSLPDQPPVQQPPMQPQFTPCASDDPQVMQTAFSSIKSFAFSGNGFNMSEQDSTNYAVQWTQRYACSAAAAFISDGQSIYQMAFEGNGFNLSGPQANDYVKNALERRCASGVNFAQEVQSYYNFAFSGTGMNMSGPDANAYARKQMEAKYFSCDGIHR